MGLFLILGVHVDPYSSPIERLGKQRLEPATGRPTQLGALRLPHTRPLAPVTRFQRMGWTRWPQRALATLRDVSVRRSTQKTEEQKSVLAVLMAFPREVRCCFTLLHVCRDTIYFSIIVMFLSNIKGYSCIFLGVLVFCENGRVKKQLSRLKTDHFWREPAGLPT